MVALGIRLEDQADGSSVWKPEDPAVLRAEAEERARAAAEARLKKLRLQLESRRKDLEKFQKLAALPAVQVGGEGAGVVCCAVLWGEVGRGWCQREGLEMSWLAALPPAQVGSMGGGGGQEGGTQGGVHLPRLPGCSWAAHICRRRCCCCRRPPACLQEALRDKYSQFDPASGEPTHDKEGKPLEGKALDKARKELEKQHKVGWAGRGGPAGVGGIGRGGQESEQRNEVGSGG